MLPSPEMPRFPSISAPAAAMPASIFARLVEKLARHDGETYPFHLGDTYLSPPVGARLESLGTPEVAGDARNYRYGAPAGDPELIAAVRAKLAARNGLEVGPGGVQITCGATHAFSCAARALFEPGDEVLLLTPCWPLFRGHVLAAGACPVEAPFSSRLLAEPGCNPRALLAPFIGPKTAAIYFVTPNNPDGKVLGRRELDAIADVARAHDLWVLADEVYEDFCFDGRTHLSIATLPGMAERTLTVHSFSKSYGQAGFRIGTLAGPEAVVTPIRKLANHSVYNVARALQGAALAALQGGAGFLAEARVTYEEARDLTVARLELPCRVPEGGSYVFVDLAPRLRPGETPLALLERLAEAGILLAPGEAFGAASASYARLCYTALPRARLEAGLARMAAVLGSG